ncbi:MAG: ATP-binding protein, partial [Bacteriovoracia bacterium]
MIERKITNELKLLAKEYPVVTVIGPRQSGKTTLVKHIFPEYQYCSLEDIDMRDFAQSDPRAFFKKFSGFTIIDEIQRVPELLSYIQTIVDEEKLNGRFIITGSHQLKLKAEVTQSLAGRTAVLKLLPLSISELSSIGCELDRDELCFRGFYPKIYSENVRPHRLLANYYETYLERDVRQLINLKDLSLFQNFIKLLAGRVGQILNLTSLANDTGVSSTTLKEWLSILEASFVIFKLPPYYENFGKRVIKSPKYYFTDVGLLCYLLGIEKAEQVARDPLLGNIFENMVVIEFLKERYARGEEAGLYFFRDSNGNEVDLVLKQGRALIPIDLTASSPFPSPFLPVLLPFPSLAASSASGLVFFAGALSPARAAPRVLPSRALASVFASRSPGALPAPPLRPF